MFRSVLIASIMFFFACFTPEDVPIAPEDRPVATTTTAVSAKKDAGVENSAPTALTAASSSSESVTRHLPGTAITTATGKYVYLVQSDGTAAPFASDALVTASGYKEEMIITVTQTELYCYGRGDQIVSALPAPSGDLLRNGELVKEKGKSDTYAISDGVAWPIINGVVFAKAGYDFANVVELPAGSLAGRVDAVGNCVTGIACLDEAYLITCAQEVVGDLTPTVANTSTATQVATFTPTNTATQVATTTPTATQTAVATSTPTVTPTATTTAVATTPNTASVTTVATVTPTATATQTATSSSTATSTTSVSATVTSTTTATVTSNQQPATVDLTWAWNSVGAKLCLNAAYFVGTGTAVLLIWQGSGADALNGPVAGKDNGRFCWDFTGKTPGSYRFWADSPISSCTGGVCPRDHDDSTGALYYRGTLLTSASHAWLYCPTADSGCDGIAYWDGASWTPTGN